MLFKDVAFIALVEQLEKDPWIFMKGKRKELIKLEKQQTLNSIADLKLQKIELENEAKKLTFMERMGQIFVKTKDQQGKTTKEEQDAIDAKEKQITDLENKLLNIEINELPDAPKVKTPEEKEKEQKRLLDRVDKLQKQSLEVSLSKEEKEIDQVQIEIQDQTKR